MKGLIGLFVMCLMIMCGSLVYAQTAVSPEAAAVLKAQLAATQRVLMQIRAEAALKEYQALISQKSQELSTLIDEAFKAAGKSKDEYTLDLDKGVFVKKEPTNGESK